MLQNQSSISQVNKNHQNSHSSFLRDMSLQQIKKSSLNINIIDQTQSPSYSSFLPQMISSKNQQQANNQSVISSNIWKDLTSRVIDKDQSFQEKLQKKRIREGSEIVKRTIRKWKDDLKEQIGEGQNMMSARNINNLSKMFNGTTPFLDEMSLNDQAKTERTRRHASIEDVLHDSKLSSNLKVKKQLYNANCVSAVELTQFQDTMNTMKTLQNVKFYNFFRDFQFPSDVQGIKEFVKIHKKTKPFKLIYNLMKKHIEKVKANPQQQQRSISQQEGQQDSPLVNQQDFRKNVIMQERDQLKLLVSWFDQMMQSHLGQRIEQLLIIAFAMGDLIQMSFVDCHQKGQLLFKILKHFLNNSVKSIEKDLRLEEINKELIKKVKNKDKLIKSLESKVVKQQRKNRELKEEYADFASKHTKLEIELEVLKKKYALELRLSQNRYDQELEEMKQINDSQKTIIMGTLEQMLVLKSNGAGPLDLKTKGGRKQAETYFAKKLGRQDSLTIDITRKNAEINLQEQKLFDLEIQKQKLDQVLTTMENEILALEERRHKYVVEVEVQCDIKEFADRATSYDRKLFIRDLGVQVTPPEKYYDQAELDPIVEFLPVTNQGIQADQVEIHIEMRERYGITFDEISNIGSIKEYEEQDIIDHISNSREDESNRILIQIQKSQQDVGNGEEIGQHNEEQEDLEQEVMALSVNGAIQNQENGRYKTQNTNEEKMYLFEQTITDNQGSMLQVKSVEEQWDEVKQYLLQKGIGSLEEIKGLVEQKHKQQDNQLIDLEMVSLNHNKVQTTKHIKEENNNNQELDFSLNNISRKKRFMKSKFKSHLNFSIDLENQEDGGLNNTLNLSYIKDDENINNQLLSQFEFKLKRSKRPLLNALLDTSDLQKLFNVLTRNLNGQNPKDSVANLLQRLSGKKSNSSHMIDTKQKGGVNQGTTFESKENVIFENEHEHEDEEPHQQTFLNDSQVAQTELPKILMRLTEKFRQTIHGLNKDEYGDLMLKPKDGNDLKSQQVIQQSQKLKGWIDRLREEKQKEFKKEGNYFVEIGIQTDNDLLGGMQEFLIMKMQNDGQKKLREIYLRAKEKNTKMQELQEHFVKNEQLKMFSQKEDSIRSMYKSVDASKSSILSLQQQVQIQKNVNMKKNSAKLQFMEFNFGLMSLKGQTHPMRGLTDRFFQAMDKKDQKFFDGIQAQSMRLLIKTMSQYLADKGTNAIDQMSVRNQHISEFVYDQNFKKFGIAKITEKKVKEILLTIEKNKAHIPKCEFYARIMGISSTANYSNDDLTHFYQVIKMLTSFNAFDNVNTQRKLFYFDGNLINSETFAQSLQMYYQDKIKDLEKQQQLVEDVKSIVIDIHQIRVKPLSKEPINLKEYQIPSEIAYNYLIQKYQQCKLNILRYLVSQKLIEHNYEDSEGENWYFDYYRIQMSQDEFFKLIQKINRNVRVSFEQLLKIFERSKVQFLPEIKTVMTSQAKINMYKISLEKVTAAIFKLNLIPL